MQNVAAALEEMRLGQEPRMGGTHKNKRQEAERRPRTGAGDGLTPTGCAQMVPDEGTVAQGRFLPLKPLTEPELTEGSFARKSHAPGSAPAEWKKPRDMPK